MRPACAASTSIPEDHADGVAEWEKIAAQHEPIVTGDPQRDRRAASDLRFFEQPIGCSTGKLPAGIEVKGEGSYIVVPPSRRKGRAYTVHNDIDPGPLPEWLHELITGGRKRSSTSRSAARSPPTRRARRRDRRDPNDAM